MTRSISIGFATLLVINLTLKANEDTSDLAQVFQEGKVSGNVRSIYSLFDNRLKPDIYATAVGFGLKYEFRPLDRFDVGIAFCTTYDMDFASGKNEKKMMIYQEQKDIVHS